MALAEVTSFRFLERLQTVSTNKVEETYVNLVLTHVYNVHLFTHMYIHPNTHQYNAPLIITGDHSFKSFTEHFSLAEFFFIQHILIMLLPPQFFP